MSSEEGVIRVLHVDDEPDFGDLVATYLERVSDDIAVSTESDPSCALDRITTESFDCIVSDHDMPNMDGLDLLRAVRREYPELPFILFTGKGSEEIASDAISAGVTEYIQKRRGTEHYAVLANRIERAVGEKRAKMALEESERQLSTLISNLPGIVYRCRNESDWPMEFVSEGAESICGYDSVSLERGDVSWGDLIPETDRDRLRETIQTCIDAGEPFEMTYSIETRDGEGRWMWERGRKVDETDAGVEILEGFITDITVRKEREMELERERAFTEKLTNAIDDSFLLLTPDGSLLRWNDTVNEVTGYTDDELSTLHLVDLVDESHERLVSDAIERALETGHVTLEAPIVTKDGSELLYEFRGSLIEEDDGELLGIAGIAREISDRKRQERRYQQYETLVENVGDAMYVLDTDGTIQMANSAMAAHLSCDIEEIQGSHVSEFMPAADVTRGETTIRRLLENGQTWGTFEMRTIAAGGTTTENEAKIAPLLDGGEYVGSVGILHDISDRKHREEELERYETVIEAVGDPVYTLDTDGVFTYVNEAIEEMTGYTPAELVGEHIGIIMTDEDVERGEEIIRDLLGAGEDRHATMEMDVVTKWDEHIPCENNMAVLQKEDSQFRGTAGVIRDIAERKEREHRLAEFASVVSHDLRSPLNVVQGRIDMARESGKLTHLDEAAAGTERMEELIQNLLTLARQGETVSELNPVDVEVAARQAWKTINATSATLDIEDTTVLDADAARLREVLENLFRNSVEHGGEDVTVTVGVLTSSDDESDGFYVADNGPGIPEAKRSDVFEHGYTTSNGGTGFGLAIVENIATAHEWTVELTEGDGGGARFEFRTNPDGQ